MSDVTPPSGDWSGPIAYVAAASAAVAAVLKRGMSAHKVRNAINEITTPILKDVAVLNSEYREISRRLEGLERGQVRLENKLDRALEARR